MSRLITLFLSSGLLPPRFDIDLFDWREFCNVGVRNRALLHAQKSGACSLKPFSLIDAKICELTISEPSKNHASSRDMIDSLGLLLVPASPSLSMFFTLLAGPTVSLVLQVHRKSLRRVMHQCKFLLALSSLALTKSIAKKGPVKALWLTSHVLVACYVELYRLIFCLTMDRILLNNEGILHLFRVPREKRIFCFPSGFECCVAKIPSILQWILPSAGIRSTLGHIW